MDSNGTGYLAFTGYPYSKLPLAGKTGTATTSSVKTAAPTALFVAFGPATGSTGAPQYCAAVIIPQAGYGADAVSYTHLRRRGTPQVTEATVGGAAEAATTGGYGRSHGPRRPALASHRWRRRTRPIVRDSGSLRAR